MTVLSELERYSQQIKLEEIGIQGQIKLRKAKVLCIGAGGIGATLLPYLAGAGVGTIGVIDGDIIEENNLHRQILYQEMDAGKAKADVAKVKIHALNSSNTIHAYAFRLTACNAEEIIAQYDLVADCSDNFYTRYLVHDTCYRLGKPYVYASAYQFQGHCSLFYGQENPCLHCLFPILPDMGVNCQTGGVLGTLPGLLGLLQATEIIKWITTSTASLLNRLLCIDLLSMEIKKIQLIKNEECQFCVFGKTLEASVFCTPADEMQFFTIALEDLSRFLQENPEVFLLDVRTADEHYHNNLGGKLIPLAELPMRLDELNPLEPILIYCQSGQRSQRAVLLLRQAGFRAVYHLANGISSL
ncbi:TPA: ThiF family adenylyltransferase [Legionella anisa]